MLPRESLWNMPGTHKYSSAVSMIWSELSFWMDRSFHISKSSLVGSIKSSFYAFKSSYQVLHGDTEQVRYPCTPSFITAGSKQTRKCISWRLSRSHSDPANYIARREICRKNPKELLWRLRLPLRQTTPLYQTVPRTACCRSWTPIKLQARSSGPLLYQRGWGQALKTEYLLINVL